MKAQEHISKLSSTHSYHCFLPLCPLNGTLLGPVIITDLILPGKILVSQSSVVGVRLSLCTRLYSGYKSKYQ